MFVETIQKKQPMGNLVCEMTSRREPSFPPVVTYIPLTRNTFAPYGLKNPSGGWKAFADRDTGNKRAAGVNTAQVDKQGLPGKRRLSLLMITRPGRTGVKLENNAVGIPREMAESHQCLLLPEGVDLQALVCFGGISEPNINISSYFIITFSCTRHLPNTDVNDMVSQLERGRRGGWQSNHEGFY